MKNLPQDLKLLVTLRSIINDHRNKILLIKRSDINKTNRGKWEIPGGKITEHKSIKEATEMEVYEETGLLVTATEDNYYCYSRYVDDYEKYMGFTYVQITSESFHVAGDVKLSSEHSEYKWLDLEIAIEFDLTQESKSALVKYYKDVDRLNKLEEPQIRSARIVARALIQKDRKYLFLRRAPTNTRPNTWELPGGKLNILESINSSIIREVFEETGLVVNILKPVVYINSLINDRGRHKGFTYVNIVSETKITSGKIKITTKHDAYKWVTAKEIFDLDLAPYMGMQLTEIFLKQK